MVSHTITMPSLSPAHWTLIRAPLPCWCCWFTSDTDLRCRSVDILAREPTELSTHPMP